MIPKKPLKIRPIAENMSPAMDIAVRAICIIPMIKTGMAVTMIQTIHSRIVSYRLIRLAASQKLSVNRQIYIIADHYKTAGHITKVNGILDQIYIKITFHTYAIVRRCHALFT